VSFVMCVDIKVQEIVSGHLPVQLEIRVEDRRQKNKVIEKSSEKSMLDLRNK